MVYSSYQLTACLANEHSEDNQGLHFGYIDDKAEKGSPLHIEKSKDRV